MASTYGLLSVLSVIGVEYAPVLPISTYSKYGIEDFLNKLVKIIETEKFDNELVKEGKKWAP